MIQRGKALLRRSGICVPAILLVFACVFAHAQIGGSTPLLIRLTPNGSIRQLASQYGLTILDGISPLQIYEISVQNQNAQYRTELLLKANSQVMYCEEEPHITCPEFQADPFHLAFEVSASPAAYTNQNAYIQIHLGNMTPVNPNLPPVIVAVLDTGVDVRNPALAGRLVAGYNAVSPASEPLDIPDGLNNTIVGHGTMVSGVIARTSPQSVIMPVRVINADGVGKLMSVIKGIYMAMWKGAGVINMSFETNVPSITLDNVLNVAYNAGVVLVASAGNDSTSEPRFPAAYSNVIGVASVEANNTLSTYSNYGVNASVEAPGTRIRSTYLGNTFATWAGTSFATPFVAAEAAEILARNRNWSPGQVTSTIMHTATNIDYFNPGYANMLGAGVIDIQKALSGRQ